MLDRPPPNSLEEVRIHGEISDDPADLAEIADAVVRGCSICYARIKSLRALIEAVQAHPDAKLAPPREERGEDWKPPDGESAESLAHLNIYRCEIEDARCCELDIRIMLTARARFAGGVGFRLASFAARAKFTGTCFAKGASFLEATFAGNADFRWACFSDLASFDGARFSSNTEFDEARFEDHATFNFATFVGDNARFRWANFESSAWFIGARFAGTATFWEATFAGDAWFPGANFGQDAAFTRASFEGTAGFAEAGFARGVRLRETTIAQRLLLTSLKEQPSWIDLFEVNLRPGATVELSLNQLKREDQSARAPSDEPWMIERDRFSSWVATHSIQSPLRWLLEYTDIVLWVRHPLRHAFGLGVRGAVFEDEHSEHPVGLRRSAAQYNILRDNFRTQPSTDKHEDLCHFRYMELTRRAAWRDKPSPWERVKLGFEWLVMRNMLGYMIYPGRIFATAVLVILLFTFIFGIWAGEGTITHNAALTPAAAIAQWDADPLNPLYFSLMTFVTLGYGDFAPLGWFKLWCGIEGLVGVGLLALFTVAWGRKMIR